MNLFNAFLRYRKIIIFILICVCLYNERANFVIFSFHFFPKKGDEHGDLLKSMLRACGDSAIRPAIQMIRSGETHKRRFCYIESVFEWSGDTGRKALLSAIQEEIKKGKSFSSLTNLIVVWQEIFCDYSFLRLWIYECENIRSKLPNTAAWNFLHMYSCLESTCDTPTLSAKPIDDTDFPDFEINKEVLVWLDEYECTN